jgi:hypothetical protein
LPIDEARQFKAADIAVTGFSESFAAISGEQTLGLSLFIRKWNRTELNSTKREGPEQLSILPFARTRCLTFRVLHKPSVSGAPIRMR